MARCLIVGCGCRGRLLAGELIARGHAVRGTTRDPSQRGAIEATGAEAFVGDPDRMATLTEAFDQVTVACVLLGSAVGAPADLAALLEADPAEHRAWTLAALAAIDSALAGDPAGSR